MNEFAVIILVAIVGEYALSALASVLNLRALSPALPAEFGGVFEGERYARSQEYTRTRTRFGLVRGAVSLAVVLAWWQAGGFEWLDQLLRGAGYGSIVTGLLYIGALGLASTVLGLPFRIYSTFVIEQRFGFNRTTPATFAADLVKSLALTLVLGGVLLGAVLVFFEWTGALAWLWCWLAATAFLLVFQFVAPTWIMPLFNTFTPLESGALRDAILDYARRADFPVRDIFVVDGSRRSSKANAFFTGSAATSGSASSTRSSATTAWASWSPSSRTRWATTRRGTSRRGWRCRSATWARCSSSCRWCCGRRACSKRST